MSDHPAKPRVKRRLALLHYHLRPGGVTTVIENTLAGLMAFGDFEVVILSGESYEGKNLANVQSVSAMSYGAEVEPETLAEALVEAAKRGLGGALPDAWHCHNHALGKNGALAAALGILVRDGHRFLFQLHDFAEDGRPENYQVMQARGDAYPMLPSVHYATVNRRDADFLVKAGLCESRVHVLPNPVLAHNEDRHAQGPRPIVLYPTRGIQRKNLGEAVLLAALCQDSAFFATTRTPENPRWLPVHDAWVEYAAGLELPIAFGVVDRQSPARLKVANETGRSLKAWLRSASCMLTTSVAEGFGLTFIESLLEGLPLLGRDLPEITRDFTVQGLSFPGLYQAIRVPLGWVGEDRLVESLERGLGATFRAYGRSLPKGAVLRAFHAMVDGHGRIDFGRLSESFQRDVIDHVIKASAASEIIIETPGALVGVDLWLESWFEEGLNIPDLNEQLRILKRTASPRACTERLLAAYDALEKEPTATLEANLDSGISDQLLTHFLSPERFHFLRS